MKRKNKNTNQLNSQTMIQSIPFSFNDSQIKNCPSGVLQVLPAPGAGKINAYLFASVDFDTSEGAYDNLVNDAALLFTHVDGLDGICSSFFSLRNFNEEATRRTAILPPANKTYLSGTLSGSFIDPNETSQIENRAISIFIHNEENNLNGGHALNKLSGVLYYVVVDL